MAKGPVRVHVVDQDERTSIVQVHGAGPDVELFVKSSGAVTDQSMWVPLVLPVAMLHGKDLHVHGAVDERLLAGADHAQTLLTKWWPQLSKVRVVVDNTTTKPPPDGVGLAFSGGVDAFHSLQRNVEDVTHLWFVHGFDVPLWRTRLRAQISEHLRQIAAATGKEFVEVFTNVKPWVDRHIRWGEIYHGAATAGVAIGHAPLWGRALIASSHVKADLHPWGSHPDLDPLWSSSGVSVVHDAVEFDRVEKVEAIAGWDVAMDHLRVCWLNPDQEYNCGKCDKCVRTKINLLAVGGYSRTLPGDVTVDMIRPIPPGEAAYHAQTNIRYLQAAGVRPDLVAALKEGLELGPAALRKARIRKVARRIRRLG